MHSTVQYHVLRLLPGDELVQSLSRFVQAQGIQAGFIAAAVGSLSEVRLRFAGQETAWQQQGCFEVIALGGTLDADGQGHLHLSLSDERGTMLGGHLLGEARVRTTMELVIGELTALRFEREHCQHSGYPELACSGRTQA